MGETGIYMNIGPNRGDQKDSLVGLFPYIPPPITTPDVRVPDALPGNTICEPLSFNAAAK